MEGFPQGLAGMPETRGSINWPGIVSYRSCGCSKDNATLRKSAKIKRFFQEVRDLKNLADEKTLNWLTNIPWCLFNDTIPLFEDADGSEQYRIRPSPCILQKRDAALDNHQGVRSLSYINLTNNKRRALNLGGSRLVVYIGRLCVYLLGGREESIWTGYDVLVGYDLTLWMVFNNHVNEIRGFPGTKYHLPCKLTKSPIVASSCFDLARFGSLHKIETTTLEEAIELVEVCNTTDPQSKVEFGLISTRQVHRVLLRQELKGIVMMDTVNRPKFRQLEARYTHDTVKNNITAGILVRAAANRRCGSSMMEYILQRYGPLRELIEDSPAIVTAAAGNTNYGYRIINILYERHLGANNKKRKLQVSKIAFMKAAMDERHGLPMLKLFFHNLRERVFFGYMIATWKGQCAPDEEEEHRLMPEAQRGLHKYLFEIYPFLWA
ncbi:hypothetical protein F4679DRAFT_588124 [Xylaria curta]|nr:hypothetical protein F4679DRAFT_588124 [Xylaria curta]